MEKAQLIAELEIFRAKLKEHQELYVVSLDRHVPDYPIKNSKELRAQSEWLTRKMGALRPEIEKYSSGWIMYHQMTGASWDALEAAVGMGHVAPAKAPSITSALDKLNVIIGMIEAGAEAEATKSSTEIEGVLNSLHPQVAPVYKGIFADGYYDLVKIEAAKAVFEYIRKKTGLDKDGNTLAELAFSANNPKLSYGELTNETAKNLQQGMLFLVKGLATHFRNPAVHEYGKTEQKTAALEIILFCSLLCRRVDDAEVVDSAGSIRSVN
jgi:uncharacterized protein (TIGR02391 family)